MMQVVKGLKGNKTEAIRLLDLSLNLHIQNTKTSTSNLDFYIKLNADFLMELAQEYLVHCGAKPKITSAGPPKYLIKAIKLLENVTKQNNALTQAQVLLAKARWLFNDTPGALREIGDCLNKDQTVVEAHILAALINSDAGNMKAADNYLKQAFSQDFTIKDNPAFMLMRSEVEIKQKDWESAKKTLEHIYKLPIVQNPEAAQQMNVNNGSFG
jgi:tetratricopeptide repeat protein 21B